MRNRFTYFNPDQFDDHIPVWSQFLAGYRNVPRQALEIGSFEGRSACWFVENILTHPASQITCIDTFTARPVEVMKFNITTTGHPEKFRILTGDSREVVKMLGLENQTFDFAYIDGDHTWRGVFQDGVGVFPMIKPGGIIIFDDYEYNGGGEQIPKIGIDLFCQRFKQQFEPLHVGWQVIGRKL